MAREYRNSEYFNEKDIFSFENSLGQKILSKVHKQNGCWWTNEKPNYKATSLPCEKINI